MNNFEHYVVFDLEATCHERGKEPTGFKNEIIEIGAVKISADGKTIDKFQAFLKPKRNPKLSEFCKQLTSITQDDIDNAKHADEVLEDFLEWTGEALFVSWGHYDLHQMNDDLALNGFEYRIPGKQHRSLKHLHAEWNSLREKKGYGLGKAMRFEKLTFEGTAHRGIDDAINITKIFVKYLHRFSLNS